MSSSESTNNEAKESAPEFYCTRCGVKSSMRKETECIRIGMSHEHNFQAYPKDTYCTRCGIIPGERTKCFGEYEWSKHSFTLHPQDTYCIRCGLKPGTKTRTECVGKSVHSFTSHPKDTHCRRCGVKPGARTECVSTDLRHDFV
jgi:rubredoxin